MLKTMEFVILKYLSKSPNGKFCEYIAIMRGQLFFVATSNISILL